MSITAILWAFNVDANGPTNKLVLLALANYAQNGSYKCWPSQDTLATVTGYKDRTIRKALKELGELGLIKRAHRKRQGSYNSDLITLLVGAHSNRSDDDSAAPTSDTSQRHLVPSQRQEVPPNLSDNNQSDLNIPPPNTSCWVPPRGHPLYFDLPDVEENAGSLVEWHRITKNRRLAENWRPDEIDIRAAYANDLDLGELPRQVESFYYFYHSEGGPHAFRTDWRKAWRNWVRKNVTENPRIKGEEPANAALLARLLKQMAEACQ